MIRRFRSDPRVLAWDPFNEPDNANLVSYASVELPAEVKEPAAEALLRKAFAWARSMSPAQPITAGVWQGDWSNPNTLSSMNELMLIESDVISFHSYGSPGEVERLVAGLQQYGRPILCTEYMARTTGNTFEAILPYYAAENIGAYNWGLVSGRAQTIYEWFSWFTMDPSDADHWFHDIFHADGTPYDTEEVDVIRALTGAN